jgi:lysophospholipase L1-like esterase
VRKAATVEEAALFDEVARSPRRFNRVLAHDFDQAMHLRYAGRVAEACRAAAIPFLDMNEALSASGFDGRWIFNDYIHLTDEGTEIAAGIVESRLSRAREAGLRRHVP